MSIDSGGRAVSAPRSMVKAKELGRSRIFIKNQVIVKKSGEHFMK